MSRALCALTIGSLVFRVQYSLIHARLVWAILFAIAATSIAWDALDRKPKGDYDRQG